jgi:hypothetical protein
MIYEHYMSLTRRLTTGQQSRDLLLASPEHHHSPSTIMDVDRGAASTMIVNANRTDMIAAEMGPTLEELIADSAQVLDWLPLEHWMIMPAGTTMTLDELPDSPNCTLPEYQLTQEWYEQTIQSLKEEEEEANVSVEAEMQIDGGRC